MKDEGVQHVPVLPREVTELLSVRPGDVVLDCTIGLGGHARLLAEAAATEGLLIGLDVDEGNLQAAAQRLEGGGCPYRLFRCNYGRFEEALDEARIDAADVILADLGVSSNQVEDATRGLSFQTEGPLDMRMDDRLSVTAGDLVNRLPEAELADIIYKYGQERLSRRIARAIHRARHRGRITTTTELAQIVCKAVGADPRSRRAKIHPATRTFQALRIAVNDELSALGALLERAPRRLRAGGRIGVISFHSLEDGIVKEDFRRRASEGIYRIVTKKPVSPDAAERERNPRSRSAKLRVAERTDVIVHD